ncbi:hypothetical protein, no similarity [Maudiozyma barnettii]|uniref:C2H2-type domain-containing protein n=1 Tax=Maudiozyma barnettii TaxID=61262 RepID=A0A8H2VGJ5_9SACH|nr:hypothetical protein, no similarity [Kazachstania barnettii]CAB4255259.1 hypothetical protein, no similarity [Kazachstania barnettii]CAD1783666.1 hypothetical protein, no similarity [Kazachstania barnettii]
MTFQSDPVNFILPHGAEDPFLLSAELNLEDPLGDFSYLPSDIGIGNFRPIINPLEQYNIIANNMVTDHTQQENHNNNNITREAIQLGHVESNPRLTDYIGPVNRVEISKSPSPEQNDNVVEVEDSSQVVSVIDLFLENNADETQQYSEEVTSQNETTRASYSLNMVNNRGEKEGAKQKKTHRCVDCLRMCQSDSHLDRHMETVHSEERPWRCPACLKKRFKRKDHLVKHLKTLHQWGSQQIEGLQTPQVILDRKKKRKKPPKNKN